MQQWQGAACKTQQDGLFVALSELRDMEEFPRRGDSAGVGHPQSSFDAASTIFLFLSHRWLAPSMVLEEAHPDLPREGSPKLKLVVSACDQLMNALPEGFGVAVWMDWMSLNQDGNPAAELGGSMQCLIGSCDMLLTPIHDPTHRKWSRPSAWSDYYTQYKAPAWQGANNPHAYWSRPWCRIEATFAAVTPHPDSEARQRKVAALEGRPLGSMMAAGRRPHLLYGTKEMEELRPPLFLPPMLHAQLDKYGADKVLGNLTSQADRGLIEGYVAEAKRCQPLLEVGLVELGGGGRVRYTYDSGAVYEGGWRDGLRHGRGTHMYASGEVYEGEWHDGKQHGRGRFMIASGEVYEGEYQDGKMHGRGKYGYANGDAYDGEFKEGKKHGRGTLTYADGGEYDGHWKEGRKHGHGRDVHADGAVYVGGWEDDKKHGRGKYTYADGDVFEGEYKGGKRHGRGRFTAAGGGGVQKGKWKNGAFVG